MAHYPTKEEFIACFSPVKIGLQGKCPRCCETSLFQSPLKIKKKCEKCGLDYSFAGPADGPSFFAMSLMCFLAAGLTLTMRFVFEASGAVVIAVVLPFVLIGTTVFLHLLRGWFVCAEYYIKVRDGRLNYPND